MIEISIDASTTHCGIAIFRCGILVEHSVVEFQGTWSMEKLGNICDHFVDLFERWNPYSVLIEEPLVFAKQSRSVAMLNQVGGAIFAVALGYTRDVTFFHGQKVKKYLEFKTKEESIAVARKMNNLGQISEHEADAINLHYAYNMFVDSLWSEGAVTSYEKVVSEINRENRKKKPTSKPKNRSKSN